MSDQPDAVVTEIPKQNFWARNKKRVVQAAAVTGGVILGGVYLKRKLNCSCDVDASVNAHVETDDQNDN